ncbi:tyrosine-type recombinase/integrase [Streptomyces sp. ME01-18a]|uniref:tyrosine-type recombinase/integrase n=1 Tax=Streptomyces sp. ME01-18a TaxID=3028669 RepID=UPI0029B108DB|nr:tyrosine-type recombinase/integrase [Streptomyces sp. ME01-18a]MDX3434239.1 tyrosine-type recombinase/integrase [Streptomyces sp. ME01-18a]
MLAHTRRHGPGPDAYSPIRIATAPKAPATVTAGEIRRLVDACARLRDRFLILLLSETGLRIGEALGLRHEDLRLRAGEVRVVPRESNVNAARVKGLKPPHGPGRDRNFRRLRRLHGERVRDAGL